MEIAQWMYISEFSKELGSWMRFRYFAQLKLLVYCINYNFNYHQFYEYQGLYHGDVKAVQCRIITKVMKGKFEEYWILI